VVLILWGKLIAAVMESATLARARGTQRGLSRSRRLNGRISRCLPRDRRRRLSLSTHRRVSRTDDGSLLPRSAALKSL